MNRAKDQPAAARNSGKEVPDTDLSLETTSSQTLRGLRVVESSSSGYNPYDTTPGRTTATGMHRLDDMRRLSEWIRMKRHVDQAQRDEQDKKK
jgi:hypothetical protein